VTKNIGKLERGIRVGVGLGILSLAFVGPQSSRGGAACSTSGRSAGPDEPLPDLCEQRGRGRRGTSGPT
jgi:hypothetical protein